VVANEAERLVYLSLRVDFPDTVLFPPMRGPEFGDMQVIQFWAIVEHALLPRWREVGTSAFPILVAIPGSAATA